MKSENIKVLDCTLRDGGYNNNWNFDNFNIKRIVNSLYQSGVDIIECGYISDKGQVDQNTTIFRELGQVESLFQEINKEIKLVAMIDYGNYKSEFIKKIEMLNGIRLAFHKKDWRKALKEAKKISEKGYEVFLQPMVTLNYSDEEILELIREVNKLDIKAFYIVDSFGAMKREDLIRISYLINHNLRENIELGLHGHNNLQLAYSNAIEFLNISTNRKIIIDASVLGMGRGAGNLNTELFLNYLTENLNKKYNIEPLLDIIDKYLYRLYKCNYWGYSIAHYLSAIYNCHPNYSSYLVDKKTMTISNIEKILKGLKSEKKESFDRNYIEELYIASSSITFIEKHRLIELKENLLGKDVCIIAPGKSIIESIIKDNIYGENRVFISINHVLNEISSDYYFFSNNKRYVEYVEKLDNKEILEKDSKFIFTSNIKPIKRHKDAIIVSYSDLLGKTIYAKDNSMIILLNLLNTLKVDEIFIAGFDGYSKENSYLEENMEYSFSEVEISLKNKSIIEELVELKNKMKINFMTKSIYEDYLNNISVF